jgi:hypothetical protein
MRPSYSKYLSTIAIIFWIFAVISIVVWMFQPGFVVGWDLHVYERALFSLRAGHDPYLDGITVQRIFHIHFAEHPRAVPPYTYVYSPITLPLLRWIGKFSLHVSATIYWLAYVAGAITVIWVGMMAVEPEERKVFILLAPVAIFFPGLLENDVLFSGNVVYIIYGLVFAAAAIGWRRGQWGWFYLVTLAASCSKAPLLVLLVIPILSERRQWWPACLTGACGVALFAIQPLLWPSTFQNYLTAVQLQFTYNHDFSSSPVGLLADALYNVIPYTITSVVFYLFYAIPIFGILLYFSRRYLAGDLSLKQWMPVLLTGVILLYPRIMEYDVACIALPMALIMWRAFARGKTLIVTILGMAMFLISINILSRIHWRPCECLVLVGVFSVGVWNLYAELPKTSYRLPRAHREESMLVSAQM